MPTKYKIGTHDPVIRHDPGAGIWNSNAKTLKMRALKIEILEHLPFAYPVIGDDAVKHMYHYFDNSGIKYSIDLQDMIDDVQDAKTVYEREVENAKLFVQTLPVGTHSITTDTAAGGYNREVQNWNWFYAVGGYSAWIKGVAKVEQDATGRPKYRLDYEYKVADRYNWDKKKSVPIPFLNKRLPDTFMAGFHLQGLAREFDMVGSIKEAIEWDSLNPAHTVVSPPKGR